MVEESDETECRANVVPETDDSVVKLLRDESGDVESKCVRGDDAKGGLEVDGTSSAAAFIPEESVVASDARSKWKMAYYTIILYLSFIGLGMAVAIIGPTLVDLSVILQKPLDDMGLVFVARSSGYFVGSVLVAFIFDHGHRLEIFGSMNILAGICVCMAPFWQHFWSYNALIFLSGISTGVIDAGGNVMLLALWETGSAPYMQALHFFFGVGAFLAPLIAEPFLVSDATSASSPENKFQILDLMALHNGSLTNSSETTDVPYNLFTNESAITTATNNSAASFSNSTDAFRSFVASSIQVPYGIIMVCMVVIGLAFWQLAIAHRLNGTKSPFDRRTTSSPEEDEQSNRPGASLSPLVRWFTVVVMSLFFFFYVGMEVAFGQLVFTFGVTSKAGMSKEEAAFVNSAYWGAYTAMRLVCVFVAIFVSPMTMMAADFVIVTAATAVLLAAAQTHVGLWIGSALLGIGFASVFPTGIVWYESQLPVNSKIYSAFLIGSSAGEMTVPYLASSLMPVNPMNLVYIVCGVDVGCILAFLVVVLVLKQWRRG